MSKTVIWKYHLQPDLSRNITTIEIPIQHVILSVGQQDNEIMLWIMVDPESPLMQKRFFIIGTGHEMSAGQSKLIFDKFIGTVHLYDGKLVLHIFEA